MSSAAKIRREFEKFLSQEISELAKNITAELITLTPVDTTHARSNWIPTIGEPFTGIAGSPERPSTGRQRSEIARLDSFQVRRGQDIHITNNVPYISRLNDGSSTQAPRGFVQIAIQRGLAKSR